MQVSAAGFDPTSSEAALLHFGASAEQAMKYLASNQGIVPPAWLEQMHQRHHAKAATSKRPSTSAEDSEAVRKLAQAVDHDEEDYLDISLDEELEYISHYLALVRSVLE